jgi:hypothetical protein
MPLVTGSPPIQDASNLTAWTDSVSHSGPWPLVLPIWKHLAGASWKAIRVLRSGSKTENGTRSPPGSINPIHFQRFVQLVAADLSLLHDLFDLRSHGRPEFFLRFRCQMKPVGAIGCDDRACVKEVGAPKARNTLVEL